MENRSSGKKIMWMVALGVTLTLGIRFRTLTLHADEIKHSIVPEDCTILYSNAYGAIVGESKDVIPNAIVEKVVLYSQKNDKSHKRIERSGILVRYPDAKATVLVCHGFMTDKFDAGFLRQLFPVGEYNIMTFDFRAHGLCNTQEYCTLGREEAFDVIAAAHFLKDLPALKGQKLFVYGFSMGAVASIEAQAKDPVFDAMVLDCPFNSSKRVIRHNLDQIKFSLFGYEFGLPGKSILQKYALHPYVQKLVKFVLRPVTKLEPQNVTTNVSPFKPKESVKKITVPTFFIHCKNDETVPLDALKEVYANANDYKKLWITNGRRHYDSYFYNPEKYKKMVLEFIDANVNGTLDKKTTGTVIEDGEDFFAHDCVSGAN